MAKHDSVLSDKQITSSELSFARSLVFFYNSFAWFRNSNSNSECVRLHRLLDFYPTLCAHAPRFRINYWFKCFITNFHQDVNYKIGIPCVTIMLIYLPETKEGEIKEIIADLKNPPIPQKNYNAGSEIWNSVIICRKSLILFFSSCVRVCTANLFGALNFEFLQQCCSRISCSLFWFSLRPKGRLIEREKIFPGFFFGDFGFLDAFQIKNFASPLVLTSNVHKS